MLPWCQDEPDIYDLLSWDLPGLKPEGARRRRMATAQNPTRQQRPKPRLFKA